MMINDPDNPTFRPLPNDLAVGIMEESAKITLPPNNPFLTHSLPVWYEDEYGAQYCLWSVESSYYVMRADGRGAIPHSNKTFFAGARYGGALSAFIRFIVFMKAEEIEAPSENSFDDLVRDLAQLAEKLREFNIVVSLRKMQWHTENQELLNQQGALKQKFAELDAIVREEALRQHEKTGNIHPQHNITIYPRKVLTYDEKTAVEWALELGRDDLLTIDRAAFAEAYKTGHVSPEIAQMIDIHTVRLTNLEEYLEFKEEKTDEDQHPKG